MNVSVELVGVSQSDTMWMVLQYLFFVVIDSKESNNSEQIIRD